MKKNKMMLVAVVATVLMSCGGGGGRPTFGDNEYPVDVVATQNASLQSTYPATINGVQDVEIRPKVSGFLTQINVTEGQTVSAGQVLFVIDNETYQAQVRQAQAAVNTAQSAVNTAKLTFDNTKKLHASKVVGDYELQTAENTFLSAQAQLAQAQAALSSAKEALSFCYVKSPAAGVVGTLPLKKGALVSASNVLTHVSDISTMDVYFSMTEKDMLTMSQGEGGLKGAVEKFPPLKLQLADGTMYAYDGHVTSISGVIDRSTGSVQLKAQFPNPEKLLKSGGSGSIVIPSVADSAIVIPQRVVMEVQNKKFVYVLKENNKVAYTEITVDPQNDGMNYIVTSGLKVGDKYVTNGITKLTDQMEIVPITPERYQQKIDEQAKAMSASDIVNAIKK
ncbi:efflux RND transporter periplasmic adaptor subunit [Prevotella communis]|jgi:membrane fusion protein (multidrug efflux system)|uniref:Membrane fusion protein, multidrug efflux system n=1 Tax=Prevotella communis TaxID=2913614 RepID=A0A1H0IQU7_9BACT|nr:efflux RND transporter periplasmic adaptor subunit [Prevotella communis]UKK56224.1 efflux RND transporter periplasmic adaptor subunit [Prevotella communis]UKK58985.1 efflux RND transporter periplasmic adaptor subunit [Prevotella communis]UKK66948.1 efflux RND transporter periplasmic adaptor subunit [Prevotella communis]UKK70913.1 efflux RND transporter periplasmic adaptor subunit [Prevotella communis]SDH20160.1 membrane fusion protein, multidrug efflux system [Prevotella communis]